MAVVYEFFLLLTANLELWARKQVLLAIALGRELWEEPGQSDDQAGSCGGSRCGASW